MFNFKPNVDRVIIKPNENEHVTKRDSGLFVPEAQDGKPYTGEVVAVGDSELYKNFDFKIEVGDTVVYSAYAATEFVTDEEEYRILSVRDIYLVKEN